MTASVQINQTIPQNSTVRKSTSDGIVATAGANYTGAGVVLCNQQTYVKTVATAGDSVSLPDATRGLSFYVANGGANTLSVVAQTADAINGGSAGGYFVLSTLDSAFFECSRDGFWKVHYQSNLTLDTPQTLYTAVSGNTPATLTGAQMAGATDVTINMTAVLAGAGTLNSATAAQIVAAIPNAAAGQSYKLRIINSSSGAFSWTFTTATGVTLNGTMTISQNTWRDFYVTLTSLTAVAIQSIGTGTFS